MCSWASAPLYRLARSRPPFPSNAADWYWALPPITRGLLTVYLVTGLAAYIGILPLMKLYHNWSLTFKMVPEVRQGACRGHPGMVRRAQQHRRTAVVGLPSHARRSLSLGPCTSSNYAAASAAGVAAGDHLQLHWPALPALAVPAGLAVSAARS